MRQKHCVILGAGFTGLCCAHFIKALQPQTRVTVIEATSRVGGWLKSFRSPSGAIHEVGPRSIRNVYNARLILNLISDLGLEKDVVTPSSAAYDRYLYVNDTLQKIETKPWLKGPFNHPMAFYMLKHLKRAYKNEVSNDPNYDDTIYNFVLKQFGSEIADVAFSAVVRGIYAGDIRQLSVKSCFPDFVLALSFSQSFVLGMMRIQKARSKNPEFVLESNLADKLKLEKARMFSMKSGIEIIPRTIASRLKNEDEAEIKFESKCVAIEERKKTGSSTKFRIFLDCNEELNCDNIICTLPNTELKQLFEPLKANEATAFNYINQVKHASVAVVNFEFPTKSVEHIPRAFGYLVPYVQKSNIIGVTFDSFSFPEVNNGAKDNSRFSVMINNCDNSYYDEHYLNTALRDFRKHLRVEDEPNFANVNVNWNCIPQYAVGHSRIVSQFKKNFSGVRFVGPLFHPPGLVDCALNAYRTSVYICSSNE